MEQWRSERLNSRVDVLHFPSHKINESENVWATFLLRCVFYHPRTPRLVDSSHIDKTHRTLSMDFFTCHLGYGSVRANSNRLWRRATSCFIGQKWIKKHREKGKLHLTLLSCVSSILDYFLLQRHVWREYRGTRQPLAVRLRSIRGTTHIRPSQRKKLSLSLNDTNEGCRLVSQWDMSKEFDSLCVSGRRATLSHLTQSFLKYNINYRINSFISECWSEQKPIFSI